MAFGSASFGSSYMSSLGLASAPGLAIEYQAAGEGARKMNLSGLTTEAQRLAGRVDTGFDDRTKQWLNEALDRWVVRDPWGTLTKEQDFPSDGTQDLILPNYVKKIISITDKTNKFPVERFENLEKHATSSLIAETAGKAYYWEERGMSVLRWRPPGVASFSCPPISSTCGERSSPHRSFTRL